MSDTLISLSNLSRFKTNLDNNFVPNTSSDDISIRSEKERILLTAYGDIDLTSETDRVVLEGKTGGTFRKMDGGLISVGDNVNITTDTGDIDIKSTTGNVTIDATSDNSSVYINGNNGVSITSVNDSIILTADEAIDIISEDNAIVLKAKNGSVDITSESDAITLSNSGSGCDINLNTNAVNINGKPIADFVVEDSGVVDVKGYVDTARTIKDKVAEVRYIKYNSGLMIIIGKSFPLNSQGNFYVENGSGHIYFPVSFVGLPIIISSMSLLYPNFGNFLVSVSSSILRHSVDNSTYNPYNYFSAAGVSSELQLCKYIAIGKWK